MVLAALRQVDKSFGKEPVLTGASLELRAFARTALVGRNGSGKTTLLRLLAGTDVPDAGDAWRRDDAVVALLEQDPRFVSGTRLVDVAEIAFRDLDEMERRLVTLEAEGLDDPSRYGEWESLHERFEARGGYQRRARRDAVMHALGFAGRAHDAVDDLSGGERTRLGLARLLMQSPDVLLLDEPTNHLDLDMRRWLEGFLGRYAGAVLVVSHDRAFLDGACDHTVEVVRGDVRSGPGNPTRYRQDRAESDRIEARTRLNEQREEARLESAALQMRKWAGQNAKLMRRAKAIETRLERHRSTMLEGPEQAQRTVRFQFQEGTGGERVLDAHHLVKRFGDRTLFDVASLVVRAGERIALTGPNGAGKTTFLRVLLGELASDDPRVRIVFGTRVRVGYYDQKLSGIDPDRTLLEELVRRVGDREAHDLLGRFLFPFDAHAKKIGDLSGGERARLALLVLTLGSYDVLVLDEPTNHLDVEMIEALEDALDAYAGTLIVVSHDRRFVARLATRVFAVDDGRFEDFEGDWEFYERKRAARFGGADEEVAPAGAVRGVDGSSGLGGGGADDAKRRRLDEPVDVDPRFADLSPWQLEREVERLEEQVAALETHVADLDARLADPSGLAADDLADLGRRHAEIGNALFEAMEAWEAADHALSVKRKR